MISRFSTLMLFLYMGFQLMSQPGSLDGDFDADGKLITSIANDEDVARSVVVQPDGRIIVAGYSDNSSDRDFAVVRYNIDGSLDNSFSVDGMLTTDFGVGHDMINGMLVQPDGKILVGGYAKQGSTNDFAMARYNSDGTLDLSFGSSGKVTTDFNGGNDYIQAVAIQSNGKIVAAGYSYNLGSPEYALARYNTDGTLDNSFSVDGKLTAAFFGNFEAAMSVIIQTDQKIIAGGYVDDGANMIFGLVRFNTDGTLDHTFGTSGKVTTDINSDYDICLSLALQPDGKIVAGGYSDNGSNNDFCLVRYNSNGSLDNSFSTNGMATFDFAGDNDFGRALVVQPDGKIILAGYADISNNDFALLRLNADGTLDNSFGSNGKVSTAFYSSSDRAYAAALQPNGRIVLAGYSYANNKDNFAVARYLTGLNIGLLDFAGQLTKGLIYPNPLQDKAILTYSLAGDAFISISLYDLAGRLVRTFVTDECRPRGEHAETLDFGKQLPSGAYILGISNGNRMISVKVVK